MAPDRRRLAILIGVLAAVIAIAAYRLWPVAGPGEPARPAAGPAARSGAAVPAVTAPDVHLQALAEARPKPDEASPRDLFRFQSKPVVVPPPPQQAPPPPPPPPVMEAPTGPPPPPPPPPIGLKFIGVVEVPGSAQKIAILTDGKGIYEGREGDTIEGRYRILEIGAESLEIAYLDGRGRQTIRLSGS